MTKSDDPREVTVVSVGSVVYMETKGTFTLDHHKERRDVYVVDDRTVALAGRHYLGRLVPPDHVLGTPEFRPGLATVEIEPRTSTAKVTPAEAMKLARHDEAPTVDEYLEARPARTVVAECSVWADGKHCFHAYPDVSHDAP